MDAAQKLSISVKSHSSSINLDDAKRIKTLLNKKNSIEKIISVNKPSFKEPIKSSKHIDKPNISSKEPSQEKKIKTNPNNKQLLNKPVNKQVIPEILSKKSMGPSPNNPRKPAILPDQKSAENQKNKINNSLKPKTNNFRGTPSTNVTQNKPLKISENSNKIPPDLLFSLLKSLEIS